jgi:4-amino-4-deoxy-L-arabinose transferase-like glycosyltransferase
MPRRWEVLTCGFILILSVAAAFAVGSSARTGLLGRFWSNEAWEGPASAEQASSLPDAAHLIRGIHRGAITHGSAEWTGLLFIESGGDYQFELTGTDPAWLEVDGRPVIDQRLLRFEEGAHPIRIRFVSRTSAPALNVFLSGPNIKRHLLRVEEVFPDTKVSGSTSRRRLPGRWLRATAVAVPVAWALLLIYGVARLAGHFLWREVISVAPGAKERRPLVIVLIVGFALTVWGLTWGLDSNWAPDELLAGHVRELIQRRFADGWYDKYPVMHYVLLGIPVSAFEIASRAGLLPAESLTSQMAQLAMMRLVSVVMSLVALIAAFLCAAELYGARRATLASWSLLLTSLFVFYGKMANVDMPLACWLGLAVLGFIRIWTRSNVAAYVLFGVAAAAAMATKDQAYASLALLPIGVLAATARSQPLLLPTAVAVPIWRRWLSALVDRRVIFGGLASIAAFGVFHNLLFNFRGVVDHFQLLSTLNEGVASVPRTAKGYLDLTLQSVSILRFTLGWPLFLAAMAGVAAAVWRRERRWWLWLLLVPLSFHLTFTFPTLFVFDRYLLGGVFVAALFAGSILGDLLDRVEPAFVGRAVVAVVVGHSALSAASVNVMISRDARYAATTWIADQANEGDRVGLVGWYTPALGPSVRPVFLEAASAALTAARPEWLILNGRFATRFALDRSSRGRELLSGLDDGSLGYVEVFRHRGALPAWATLQYEAEFSRPRESVITNLDKINPEIVVYRRR